MLGKKRILVAPLDWGLGHAARCIPLIKKLIEKDFEVKLGGSGISGKLLQMEFPDLPYEEIPGYEVTYSTKLPMSIAMLRQAPGILRSIQQERKWLEEKMEREEIDVVISDHRYGLHHKNAHCIFMAHQLFISSGSNDLLEPVLWKINRSYIENFNMCWIPDLPGETNASGKLSHKLAIPFPHAFIGLLSRLTPSQQHKKRPALPVGRYQAAFILSGLEPLRTEFEHLIIDQMDRLTEGKYILIRGTNQHIKKQVPENLEVVDISDSVFTNEVIHASEMVVSRAGYSSIMDYLVAGSKALLVPTPGQTEQEYLARYHTEAGNFYSTLQDQLDLGRDLALASTFHSQFINNPNLLDLAIDELIKTRN